MTPRPDVLVVGEALVDIVHRVDGSVDRRPGGSPATVALALGRLGRRPRLLTSLGDDRDGQAVRDWLGASGVVVQGAPAARTSTGHDGQQFRSPGLVPDPRHEESADEPLPISDRLLDHVKVSVARPAPVRTRISTESSAEPCSSPNQPR